MNESEVSSGCEACGKEEKKVTFVVESDGDQSDQQLIFFSVPHFEDFRKELGSRTTH